MEIRSMKQEKKNEYPKQKEVNKKYLSKIIPITWKKIGITSFVLTMLIDNKIIAAPSSVVPNPVMTGIVAPPSPIKTIISFSSVITAIISIVFGIGLLYTFFDKNKSKTKANKVIKIVFVISIIMYLILYFIRENNLLLY